MVEKMVLPYLHEKMDPGDLPFFMAFPMAFPMYINSHGFVGGFPMDFPVTRPGKHTKNYGKSPCYSWENWENSLFLWPFSMSLCNSHYQRVTVKLNHARLDPRLHPEYPEWMARGTSSRYSLGGVAISFDPSTRPGNVLHSYGIDGP